MLTVSRFSVNQTFELSEGTIVCANSLLLLTGFDGLLDEAPDDVEDSRASEDSDDLLLGTDVDSDGATLLEDSDSDSDDVKGGGSASDNDSSGVLTLGAASPEQAERVTIEASMAVTRKTPITFFMFCTSVCRRGFPSILNKLAGCCYLSGVFFTVASRRRVLYSVRLPQISQLWASSGKAK
jgi:hypothetical protein